MRRFFKQPAMDFFVRLLRSQAAMREGDRQFALRHRHPPELHNLPAPYDNIGATGFQEAEGPGQSVVFITGRFRSGSTLLWNLFRQLDGCTAYYEPFNERQWFNPACRGDRVDSSHRGVHDYWREYESMEDLAQWYREDWIREGLYMDETSHDRSMKAYIDILIERAQGTAVLQFNRVDFRLPWLKKHYPNATIVHLHRHPRDQWLSFLADRKLMNKDDVDITYQDHFYLDVWCRDLSRYFPFLSTDMTPHPYQRFYYLWKLSLLFGKKYASVSIGFEDLVTKPQATMDQLLGHITSLAARDIGSLAVEISPPKLFAWREYAPDSWFAEHESMCEAELDRVFGRGEAATSHQAPV